VVKKSLDVDKLPIVFDTQQLMHSHQRAFAHSNLRLHSFVNIVYLIYRYVESAPKMYKKKKSDVSSTSAFLDDFSRQRDQQGGGERGGGGGGQSISRNAKTTKKKQTSERDYRRKQQQQQQQQRAMDRHIKFIDTTTNTADGGDNLASEGRKNEKHSRNSKTIAATQQQGSSSRGKGKKTRGLQIKKSRL